MKKLSLLLAVALPLLLAAQEITPEITLEKKRLLILPSAGGDDIESIDSKVTAIVAGEATALGRFEVIDRNNLKSIMDEQALQLTGIINDSDVVAIGKVAAAPEALIVTIFNFGQKGVPPEDEEEEDEKDRKEARKAGLLGIIAREVVDAAVDKALEDVERYPNNIQTTLQGEVRKIDLESGQSLASFSISVEHTGGNKSASLSKALSQVSWRVSQQLRELYLLTSQVVDVRGREVILLLGRNMGLKKGTLFAINTPDNRRTIGGREITVPGRQVGFLEVLELSQDANRGRILRKWEPIEPGYTAIEATGGIMAGGIGLKYGSQSPDLGLDFSAYFAPLRKFGGSAFFGLGTLVDSRDDTDFNLSFGGEIYFRLINTIPFSLAGSLSLPVNVAFRSDDADESHTATSLVFSPVIGGRAEIMLNAKMDLIVSAGYCLTSNQSAWKYTVSDDDDDEEDVTYPAEWDERGAPKFDTTGLYFNVGIRFLMFNVGAGMPSLSDLPDFK